MSATKLSISLEEPVALGIRRSAENQGVSVSAWLNETSRKRLAIEDGLAAVAEWEAENGPPSDEVRAEAKAVLDAAGVGREE